MTLPTGAIVNYTWGMDDRYGNQWVSSWTGMTPSSFTPLASTNFDSHNRLNITSTIAYDNPGNQTAIGGYTNTYDAENHLANSTLNSITTSFAYDGEGHRVQKTTSGVTRTYVYNVGGELVAEYTNSTATSTLNCAVCYPATDNLGSTRLITAGGTGQVVKRMDYLPFGEIIPAGMDGRTTGLGYESAEDPTAPTMRFTGKERDSETYLDYFGARYFSGAQGRFTSADWSATPQPIPYADLKQPQSLNLYTYVQNAPLSRVDADGHHDFVPSRWNWFPSVAYGGFLLVNFVPPAIAWTVNSP